MLSHRNLLFKRDDRSTFTLKVRNLTGTTEAPTTYSLREVYPNPFNPTAHFSFSVSSAAQVNIRVFPGLGDEAIHLVDMIREVGPDVAERYGTSSNGSSVGTGVYVTGWWQPRYEMVRQIIKGNLLQSEKFSHSSRQIMINERIVHGVVVNGARGLMRRPSEQ